ncbi:MAG: hypothetical protein ABIR34_04805 [Marmoricola sp.]
MHDATTHTDPGTSATAQPPSAATRVTRALFVLTLILFLIGGFVLVVAQAVEIVAGDGAKVVQLGERLGPPTFIVSTICGLLAFALEYLQPHGEDTASD